MGTTTTPPRRVTAATPTPTPKRDSPSPNSNSSSSPSPRRKSTTTPSSKPTTTRKSLLLLSKPKSLSNSPPSTSQSHPIKPSSSSNNIKSTSVPPTVRRDQHATPNPTNHQHLIASLQSQLLSLQTQLQQAQTLNLHLQSQNSNLSSQLAAAHSKISSLTTAATTNTNTTHQDSKSVSELENPKVIVIQKLSSDKLEHSAISKGDKTKTYITNTPPAQLPIASGTTLAAPSPPPPPPPPLARRPAAKSVSTQKASAVVELYQSLATKRGNGYPSGQDNSNKTGGAHNSIVDEIQNRSTHLIAIKKDIETKGELINGLIQKVLDAAYTDIEEVLCFVDWLDKQLSLLADEQAVLKHFKWPEKKADSMREAAIEYRNLKLLEEEVSSYRDDTEVPCSDALKKMGRLLDKSERSLQRLLQLRSSAMVSYRSHKIPTDWMLDTGIVSKIKQASINLARSYVKRVRLQLESIRYTEREWSSQEADLVVQGVHFAYRAHQLCGGLDSETVCAIEEMRRRVPVPAQRGGEGGSSGQLFAGISIPTS